MRWSSACEREPDERLGRLGQRAVRPGAARRRRAAATIPPAFVRRAQRADAGTRRLRRRRRSAFRAQACLLRGDQSAGPGLSAPAAWRRRRCPGTAGCRRPPARLPAFERGRHHQRDRRDHDAGHRRARGPDTLREPEVDEERDHRTEQRQVEPATTTRRRRPICAQRRRPTAHRPQRQRAVAHAPAEHRHQRQAAARQGERQHVAGAGAHHRHQAHAPAPAPPAAAHRRPPPRARRPAPRPTTPQAAATRKPPVTRWPNRHQPSSALPNTISENSTATSPLGMWRSASYTAQ